MYEGRNETVTAASCSQVELRFFMSVLESTDEFKGQTTNGRRKHRPLRGDNLGFVGPLRLSRISPCPTR